MYLRIWFGAWIYYRSHKLKTDLIATKYKKYLFQLVYSILQHIFENNFTNINLALWEFTVT